MTNYHPYVEVLDGDLGIKGIYEIESKFKTKAKRNNELKKTSVNK